MGGLHKDRLGESGGTLPSGFCVGVFGRIVQFGHPVATAKCVWRCVAASVFLPDQDQKSPRKVCASRDGAKKKRTGAKGRGRQVSWRMMTDHQKAETGKSACGNPMRNGRFSFFFLETRAAEAGEKGQHAHGA
nr:hypothetical protein [Pandoravirus belohorizontensis]